MTPDEAVASARRSAEECGIAPSAYDSGLSVAEAESLLATLATVRQRLATVEDAAERMLEVFNRTGEQRKAAIDAVVAALTTDFATAVLCSPDMSEADRAGWLAASAAGEPDAERGYDPLAVEGQG